MINKTEVYNTHRAQYLADGYGIIEASKMAMTAALNAYAPSVKELGDAAKLERYLESIADKLGIAQSFEKEIADLDNAIASLEACKVKPAELVHRLTI